ncbi:hypothetical protein UFOVP74_53 [uncultured Caudovirales phage]|uniref:Uncharacterized protein n=1 Tax=uncultured Caudovirales phage TaxID=2100421 RepID=A0A6J5L394_9CAUD|nr:hypothetical protein UFOVP74_53 [uncultured Caudovirales phage]
MKKGINKLQRPVDVLFPITCAFVQYTAKVCCRYMDDSRIDYTIANVRQHEGNSSWLIDKDDLFWGIQSRIRSSIEVSRDMQARLRELVEEEHVKYVGVLN